MNCPTCHGTGRCRQIDVRGMDSEAIDLALRAAQMTENPPCDDCGGTGAIVSTRHMWVTMWCAQCGVHQDHPDADGPCHPRRHA